MHTPHLFARGIASENKLDEEGFKEQLQKQQSEIIDLKMKLTQAQLELAAAKRYESQLTRLIGATQDKTIIDNDESNDSESQTQRDRK